MWKSLKHYLKKARKEHWALGQFNFSDFTQMKAIVDAALKLKSPIILGTSEGESKFFGLDEAVALRNVLRRQTSLPIFLNLDHGKSFDYLKQAIDVGYDMVHFDGSKLSLEENIKQTKRIKKYAWWHCVLFEGEVGRVDFETKEGYLTKPKDARKYLEQTKADLLAVSIGNFHGSGAFKQEPNLRLDVLNKIKEKVGNMPLVLHGGSGTLESDIKEAIKIGVAKININTELRAAFSGNLREALNINPDEIVPYKFLSNPEIAVEKVVESKIKLFGSENKA